MSVKILVCRTDVIGDTILTLPVINDLRTAFPNAFIAYCGQELTRPLLTRCPQIDEVLCYTDNHAFRKRLTSYSFDAAIMCYPKPARLAWCLYKCAIPVRVGSKRRWWGFLFNQGSNLSRSRSDIHESEANRQLGAIAIRALGGNDTVCQNSAKAILQIDKTESYTMQQYLKKHGIGKKYLVIQPGSRGSSVDWPLERMALVADRMHTARKKVIFHIGPGEQALEERLQRLCKNKPVFIGTGSSDKTNIDLPQLSALLQGASCVLGNSTGPLHLAAVLGTPVVGLYPPILNLHPGRWRPLGQNQLILIPPHQKLYTRRELAPANIMDAISVYEVCAAIGELWDKKRTA